MTYRTNRWRLIAIIAALFAALVPAARAATAVPGVINFQGRLLDANKLPRNGTFSMDFSVCDALSAGSCALWTESRSVVVTNGVFSVQLGAVTPLAPSVFASSVRYLEITVAGETLSPRERLVTGPFAFRSGEAEALAADPSDCTLPNVAIGINAAGTAQCSQPSNVTGSAATAGALTANGTNAGSGFLCLGVDATGNCETASVDAAATSASTSPVQSGAMFTALAGKLDLAPTAAQTVTYGAAGVQTIFKMAGSPTQNPFVIQNSGASPLFSVGTAGDITSAASGTGLTLSGAGTAIAFTGAAVGQVQTAASQDLALMPGSGHVGIGKTNPVVSLDITSTDAVQLPSGNNSTDRPAAAAGMIRYNSTNKGIEAYQGNTPAWSGMITNVNVVTYCASGCTGTTGSAYTPPVNLQYATIECVGGGGGGGGAGSTNGTAAGGGGGGGFSRKTVSYSALSVNPTMTVGAGGTAGAITAGTAGAGGASSVGSILTCNGGAGGTNSTVATTKVLGGAGGAATATGDFNIAGQAGASGFAGASVAVAFSGQGGSSHLGGGAQGKFGLAGVGNAGGNYGGGAGGAMGNPGGVGGVGGPGIIIVTEFLAGAR